MDIMYDLSCASDQPACSYVYDMNFIARFLKTERKLHRVSGSFLPHLPPPKKLKIMVSLPNQPIL